MPTKTSIHWRHKTHLISHLPKHNNFYHIDTLYLPGYITQGAVLKIIKETHNIRLTVHKYFWNGMLQGSARSKWTNKRFIYIRLNEKHIKIVHKLDTADCKPDVLKISSLHCSTQVQWNEWHIFTHKRWLFIRHKVLLTTDHCHWNYKLFHVASVDKQFFNHFLQTLLEQVQWQTSQLIFWDKMFQVTSVTSQLAYIFSPTMHWMFFQIQR